MKNALQDREIRGISIRQGIAIIISVVTFVYTGLTMFHKSNQATRDNLMLYNALKEMVVENKKQIDELKQTEKQLEIDVSILKSKTNGN